MSTNGRVLLEGRDLVAGFGSNRVLHGVSFRVHEGEIAAILGLNGAGKSVTMKVVGGLVPAWGGEVTLFGDDVTHLSAEKRVAKGMAHVPQGRQVFPELSVEQNLRLGGYTLRRHDKSRYRSALDSIFQQFPLLKDRRNQAAGSLSGGEQAMLAVARALVCQPRLILVDEASAGLAPVMVNQVFEVLKQVNESGVTILMVEQNVTFTLKIADRAHIMQTGRVVYESDVASLDRDRVADYLGVGRLLGARVSAAARARAKPPKAAAGNSEAGRRVSRKRAKPKTTKHSPNSRRRKK
jgi:branched-chain amino acid transport system ATP-binding protein